MANSDKIGGFLSGFSESFFPAQRQNRIDFDRRQQAQQIQTMRNMQIQQMQRQQMQQDQARRTAGLMATGQLHGDIGPYGRSPDELTAKYGFNPSESLPMGYQTPQQAAVLAAKTRADEFEDFERKERLKASINAEYAKEGKPEPFVVVESPSGAQRWIRKGDAIPEGFKVSKPSATTINVGGTEKPVPTEKTRLLTVSKSGLDGVDAVESILFDKDGGLNQSVVVALNAPHGAVSSGALGADASQAYSQIVGAIRDKLRLESGAVIGEEEMKREMQRYLPGVFDTPEVAKKKLDALRGVLGSYQELGGRGVVQQEGGGPSAVEKPNGVDLVYNPTTGEFE